MGVSVGTLYSSRLQKSAKVFRALGQMAYRRLERLFKKSERSSDRSNILLDRFSS
jgi:hypothetical protein